MTPQAEIRLKVMAYLSRREHTRTEIEAKLARRKFPSEAIREVLDELVGQDLISHARFIEDYLESRARRGYGPNRIRAELISKRLDGSDIDAALREASVDWLENARSCYRKKYGAGKPGSTEAGSPREYMKRKQFLYQRGYSAEVIRTVLEE